MPFGFAITAAPVSGSGVVASRLFRGIGPCRLYIKNTGDNALDACDVQIGPTLDALQSFDNSTFASLAAGQMASIPLAGPVDGVSVIAECAAGTSLSIWLADSARVVG